MYQGDLAEFMNSAFLTGTLFLRRSLTDLARYVPT